MITSYPRQGVCGDEAGSAVVCGPTQVKNKKVKMMFKVYNMVFFLDFIKSFQGIIMKKHQWSLRDLWYFRQTPLVKVTKIQRRDSRKWSWMSTPRYQAGSWLWIVMIEMAAMMESGLKMGRNGPFALSEMQSRQSVLARQRSSKQIYLFARERERERKWPPEGEARTWARERKKEREGVWILLKVLA